MIKKFLSLFDTDYFKKNRVCTKHSSLIKRLECLKKKGELRMYTDEPANSTVLELYTDNIHDFTERIRYFFANKNDLSFDLVNSYEKIRRPVQLVKWLSPGNTVNLNFKDDIDDFMSAAIDIVLWYEMARSEMSEVKESSASRALSPYIISIDDIVTLLYSGVKNK